MISAKLKYSEAFAKKDFTSGTMKGAYMNACKWYASNILANDKLKDVQVSYEKLKDTDKPTVRMHLYVSIDEKKVFDDHCEICRESHKSFYINENTDCNWCKIHAFMSRTSQRVGIKKDAYREVISNS